MVQAPVPNPLAAGEIAAAAAAAIASSSSAGGDGTTSPAAAETRPLGPLHGTAASSAAAATEAKDGGGDDGGDDDGGSPKRKKSRWGPTSSSSSSTAAAAATSEKPAAAAAAAAPAEDGQSEKPTEAVAKVAQAPKEPQPAAAAAAEKKAKTTPAAAPAATAATKSNASTAQPKPKPPAKPNPNTRPNRWGSPLGHAHVLPPPPPFGFLPPPPPPGHPHHRPHPLHPHPHHHPHHPGLPPPPPMPVGYYGYPPVGYPGGWQQPKQQKQKQKQKQKQTQKQKQKKTSGKGNGKNSGTGTSRPSSRSSTGGGKSNSSGGSGSNGGKATAGGSGAAPKKRASPKPRSTSQGAAAAAAAKTKSKATSSKAKATKSKPKPRAKRPRSSPQPQQQDNPQPPPVVGPPQGYGPVGPPPLPYHEAQLLLAGPSLHDMADMNHLPSCGVVGGVGGGVGVGGVLGNGVNGDDRTLEWEAHAEALALGLGLLDDDADDPTCSGGVGGRGTGDHPHDAYLQHGPPPAAAAAVTETAAVAEGAGGSAGAGTGTGVEEGQGAEAEAGETTKGGEGSHDDDAMDVDDAEQQPAENDAKEKASESALANNDSGADATDAAANDDISPALSLQGYRPRSSKGAAVGNDVRQQFAEANQCYGTAGGISNSSSSDQAALHRAEHETETAQEREERRRTQLRERLGRRRTTDGDDQEREFREDLAGVWYPSCSWIGAGREDGVGPSAEAEVPVAVAVAVAVAAVVDPSPSMFRRQQQQPLMQAPSVVAGQERKRSRPAGSVSFSLGNVNGIDRTAQEPAQLLQQVLQSLPSSSDLLSDLAYIDLVCRSAAKGEACKSLLASLLDAMGMELPKQRRKTTTASRSSSPGPSVTLDAYARPMREGKKPVQTPGTVREFAMTLISMGLQPAPPTDTTSTNDGMTVLEEVAAAFRLACHHVLRYVASALANSNANSRDNKSPVRRKRATKVSEFARRAYMTLFVTLRGLIVRIVDRPDSAKSMGVDAAVRSFFSSTDSSNEDSGGVASPSFSSLERLLLDTIPLLTRFAHPPLHDKHSTSLMSNLLLLDESTRKKKSKRSKDPSSADIVMVRDGLMELFVRQLADQEDLTERRLRKVLNVSSTYLSDASGAAASLNPGPSHDCILVSDGIVEYRRRQQGELEAIARRKASASSTSALAAGSATTARSVSSSWDMEDATSGATGSTSATATDNDLRLVRIDGCIYLSKIISRLLDSRPTKSSSAGEPPSGQSSNNTNISAKGGDGAGPASSSSTTSGPNNFASSSELKIKANEEKLRVHDAQKIEEVAQTAYFLFHTLVESHEAVGSFPRKNVSSAVLACFLLAGKMEDCPLKLSTILRITKNSTLPPPPFETVRQCYDKLAPNAPGALPMKWGEPSADLIKQFEFSLLTTLGFVMPENSQSLHPTASIVEIKNKLALDSNTVKHMQRLMKDPCYTHSSLCLLREPQLMAAALYYLSCQKGRSELLKDWDLVLEEEAVVVKAVADYSRWVGHCVKYRERQWNVFKALKYRVNTKTSASNATATAAGSSRTPENAVDDSLAVWSRTIPPISEFESPPLLPMELSTVTEKINGLLSAPHAEEISSPDEVQDEDYLTLAALLEIPDDAVEDSDTSPSANSVDSIAVLMDSRSEEKRAACAKNDSSGGSGAGGTKEDIGNETTIVVSPALGDERHDAMLSEEGEPRTAKSRAASEAEESQALELSAAFDTPAQATVAANDTQKTVEKSCDTPLKHGSASSKDTRGSDPVGNDVVVGQPPNVVAAANIAATVPFSPIRRKSVTSKSSTGKSKAPAWKRKVDVEVPILVEATKPKDSDDSEEKKSPADDAEDATKRGNANTKVNLSVVTSREPLREDDDASAQSRKEDAESSTAPENGSTGASSAPGPLKSADNEEGMSTDKDEPSSITESKLAALPVAPLVGQHVRTTKKQEESPDPISSPVLAAKPAPALPPVPPSPKKKLLMKAAEDAAAAAAEAASAATADKEATASSSSEVSKDKAAPPTSSQAAESSTQASRSTNTTKAPLLQSTKAAVVETIATASIDAAESNGVSDGPATFKSTMPSQPTTKPADSAKTSPPVALPSTPKVSNLDVSKISTTKTDETSMTASKLLTSPEPRAKKNDVPPKAVTPRRAAAASSLLELKVVSKLKSAETISREGSPALPKEDSKEDAEQTRNPPRRPTRSTVKAGKSPQPDMRGLAKKLAKKSPASASRKRKAVSKKKSSNSVEQPSKPVGKETKERKEKAGVSRVEPKRQSQTLVSSTSGPLKKRVVSTSEEPVSSTNAPVGDGVIPAAPTIEPTKGTDVPVPLPQGTGTTPSWYPAPNLQRLEAQAKRKGRGKKRAAEEVSSSKATSKAKSVTPSVKRRRSRRTAAPEAPSTSPESSSTQKKPTESSSSATAASSKEAPPVAPDAPTALQKGIKKGESNPEAAPVAEAIPADDDATFPMADDAGDGGDDTAHEAERVAKARALYKFTTANLEKTAPLYKNDQFRLEDKNEQPLICELASLHREAAIHFIDTMRRKPDAFWLNENVVTKAAEAFWFQLPPRVQTEEARHLYRNFADSPDNLRNPLTRESSDKPLRLRLSRREVDIILYFASNGQTAMDCHYLMPYRSRRKMREVFESIKTLIDDVKDEYMTNVTATVEALIAIEGPGGGKADTQNVIMLC